jgi:hypothetical protein
MNGPLDALCCGGMPRGSATLVEQVDVGGEANNAAARKTLQHRIFQQSGGILSGDFLGAELTANGEHLGQPFGGRCLPLRWTRRHDGHERGDHAGIERIGRQLDTRKSSRADRRSCVAD